MDLALGITVGDELRNVIIDHFSGLIVAVVDGSVNIKGFCVLGFKGQIGSSYHFECKRNFEDLLFFDFILNQRFR